jgi:rhodanese-related sulfurtransferase
MTRKITRDELVARLGAGTPLQFVETLRAEHFAQGHLPGAVHIHFEEVDERAPQVLPDKDALIVTYCSNTACQNSRIAAEKLAKLGYTDVRRYEEGKQDWAEAGLDLELELDGAVTLQGSA